MRVVISISQILKTLERQKNVREKTFREVKIKWGIKKWLRNEITSNEINDGSDSVTFNCTGSFKGPMMGPAMRSHMLFIKFAVPCALLLSFIHFSPVVTQHWPWQFSDLAERKLLKKAFSRGLWSMFTWFAVRSMYG